MGGNKRAILILRLANENQKNFIAQLFLTSAQRGTMAICEGFSLGSEIHVVGDLSVRDFGQTLLLVISSNVEGVLDISMLSTWLDAKPAIGIVSDSENSLFSVAPDLLEAAKGLASLAEPAQVLCTSDFVELASQLGASIHAAGMFEVWWERRMPVFEITSNGHSPKNLVSKMSPGFSVRFPAGITDRKGGDLVVKFDESVAFAQVQVEMDMTALVITSESLGSSGLIFAFDFTSGSTQREQRFWLEAKKVESDNKQVVAVKAIDAFGCALGPAHRQAVILTKIGRLSLKSLAGEKGEAVEIAWRSLRGSRPSLKLAIVSLLLFVFLTIGVAMYYFRFLPEDYSHRLANAGLLYFGIALPRIQPYGATTDLLVWFKDKNQWKGAGNWDFKVNYEYASSDNDSGLAARVAGKEMGWVQSQNPIEGFFDYTIQFDVTLDGSPGGQPLTRNVVWGLRGGPNKPYYRFVLHLPQPKAEKLSLDVSCEDCPGLWGGRKLETVGPVLDGSAQLAGKQWRSGYGLQIKCVPECWGFSTEVTIVGDWENAWSVDPIEFNYRDPYDRLDSGSFGFGGSEQEGPMILEVLKVSNPRRLACHDWHILPAEKK